jgi:hypothetical protein
MLLVVYLALLLYESMLKSSNTRHTYENETRKKLTPVIQAWGGGPPPPPGGAGGGWGAVARGGGLVVVALC